MIKHEILCSLKDFFLYHTYVMDWKWLSLYDCTVIN